MSNNNNTNTIRIGWYPSGNIYDVDNNGLGYGMLFWDDLLKAAQSGTKVIDSGTNEELTVEYIRSRTNKVYRNE